MDQKSKNTLIIGHRGANKEAPENTMKSFRKAIELEADYIEFDLHESKDGVLVIMHDPSTLRTTGYPGLISHMTLDKLKELDCGDGESIPTLEELIDLAKGKINLQCEVKAGGIAEKLVKILKQENLLDSTIVSSFDHDELKEIQKLEPNLKLAALEPSGVGWIKDWFKKKEIIDNAISNNFYAIHPLYKLVNKEFIEYAHEKNLKVNCWTVDSKNAMKKLIKNGVDGIITNDIKRAKELLNR
jgi:glycerophosphoryl diester phosphodiesterase